MSAAAPAVDSGGSNLAYRMMFDAGAKGDVSGGNADIAAVTKGGRTSQTLW